MWTTSNSPDNRRTLANLVVGCIVVGLASCATAHAPDSPRPAKAVSQDRPPAVVSAKKEKPAKPPELHSVKVTRFDPAMARLAGPRFMIIATNPLMIDVRISWPLVMLPPTSSLVIVLNGTRLHDTWVHPDERNRLVAFLPNRTLVRDRNTVNVVWIGREHTTLTQRPLTFAAADIED